MHCYCAIAATAPAEIEQKPLTNALDVLHRWASEQLHASSIAEKLLYAEGIGGKKGEGEGR